nr:putative Gag-Pol polyprotein [Tanacetum cinerariifolium]
MDLDHALRIDPPATHTAESTTDHKSAYEQWGGGSNRMSLMIVKNSIFVAIRGAISDSENAKEYLSSVEEQFKGTSKAHASTLIRKMLTTKYDKVSGVREHIMMMSDMANKRKGMDMEIREGKCNDPESFEDAITYDQSAHWREAMEDELNSMSKNHVSKLAELPMGAKPIGCNWVYKTKLDPNENVKRYKTRLVAKGYTQKEGVNYKETFSPVTRKDSLRIVMALVAYFYLEVHQIDVKTAFLNGDSHEDVYMAQPQDDILLASNNIDLLHESKHFLSRNFDMKDLGEASYVIRIEIHQDRSNGKLGLSQKAYIERVLNRLDMQHWSPTVALVIKGDVFGSQQCPKTKAGYEEMKRIPYASVVRSLTYAQVCTRIDITYICGMLGRFQSNPGLLH